MTVDESIQRGHRMVTYPSIVLFFIGLLFTIFLVSYFKNPWIFLFGFLISLGISWIYWSVMIPRWRILAFENCRNVHELKRIAINENLIHPDGSFFEKTEIRNDRQKRRLAAIETKFRFEDIPEIIEDDGSVPDEAKIYYSKNLIILYWIGGLFSIVFGAYMLLEKDNFGFIMLFVSLYPFYLAYKYSSIKAPYITVNSKGLKTLNTSFISWKDVEDFEVIRTGYGKRSEWFLKIYCHEFSTNENASLKIDELDVKVKKIKKLIYLSHQRYRNNQSNR